MSHMKKDFERELGQSRQPVSHSIDDYWFQLYQLRTSHERGFPAHSRYFKSRRLGADQGTSQSEDQP